jgi:hypothetical protein
VAITVHRLLGARVFKLCLQVGVPLFVLAAGFKCVRSVLQSARALFRVGNDTKLLHVVARRCGRMLQRWSTTMSVARLRVDGDVQQKAGETRRRSRVQVRCVGVRQSMDGVSMGFCLVIYHCPG